MTGILTFSAMHIYKVFFFVIFDDVLCHLSCNIIITLICVEFLSLFIIISLRQRECYRCLSNSALSKTTDGDISAEPVIELGELDPVSRKLRVHFCCEY